MEKYSKTALKAKRMKVILLVILCIIIAIIATYFAYTAIKNIIIYEKVDNLAKQVTDDEAKNSTPIIIDNLVMGATYNRRWISSDKYYMKATKKEGTEVDVYSKTGKAGKFNLGKFSKSEDSLSIYTTTTRANFSDEYIAVISGTNNIMQNKYKETEKTNEDIKFAKKALGAYRLLNTSLEVNNVYDITINEDVTGRLIFVSSAKGKNGFFGAYNAVIFVQNNSKTSLVKYAYVNNSKKSDEWPVYGIKFIADLNQDLNNDLVIQEVKEFETKYSILEYRNGKFVEVLSNKTKNVIK